MNAEERELRLYGYLGAIFVVSMFLAVALSFTLRSPDGKPGVFAACLVVSAFCFWRVKKGRIGLILSFVLVFAVRLVWALILSRSGLR